MLSAESSMNIISISGPQAKNTEGFKRHTLQTAMHSVALCETITWVSELDYRSDHSWYEASQTL